MIINLFYIGALLGILCVIGLMLLFTFKFSDMVSECLMIGSMIAFLIAMVIFAFYGVIFMDIIISKYVMTTLDITSIQVVFP